MICLIAAAAMSIVSINALAKTTFVSIGTGGTGGIYYPYGGDAGISTLSGSGKSQLDARRLYADITVMEHHMSQAEKAEAIEKRLGQINLFFEKNPNLGIDHLPDYISKGTVGLEAISRYTDMKLKTVEGQANLAKKTQELTDVRYSEFEALRFGIQQASLAGDTDTVVNMTRKLVEKTPMPYKLGEFDQESQTFELKYADSPSGEDKLVKRISLKEILSKMNNMNKKMYADTVSMNMMATHKANVDHAQNPIPMVDKSGNRYMAVPEKLLNDPTKVNVILTNQETGEYVKLDSWKDVYGLGFEKLDSYKARLLNKKITADIDRIKSATERTKNEIRLLQGTEKHKIQAAKEKADAAKTQSEISKATLRRRRREESVENAMALISDAGEDKDKIEEIIQNLSPGDRLVVKSKLAQAQKESKKEEFEYNEDKLDYIRKVIKNYDADLSLSSEDVKKLKFKAEAEFEVHHGNWKEVVFPSGEVFYQKKDGTILDSEGKPLKKIMFPDGRKGYRKEDGSILDLEGNLVYPGKGRNNSMIEDKSPTNEEYGELLNQENYREKEWLTG